MDAHLTPTYFDDEGTVRECRALVLHEVAGIFTMRVLLKHIPDTQLPTTEELIVDIQLYSHTTCAPECLVADDIEYCKLPASSQDAIDAAIVAWEHQQRQSLQRLRFGLTRLMGLTA